jgi:hypothetical protein
LQWKAQATLAPVPEATVNEHKNFSPMKNEVWLSENVAGMKTPASNCFSHQSHSKLQFGGPVSKRPDFAHQRAARFLAERVQSITAR